MQYNIVRLQGDIAQVWHKDAGFGTGRLVAENLILTAAHVLWRDEADMEAGAAPKLEEWQVRVERDHVTGVWPFRLGNRVVWHNRDRDLALILLLSPEGKPLDPPLRPGLQLRVATMKGSDPHLVEARGYPRASREEGQRDLTPAFGRLVAADQQRPLRFGVDSGDLPIDPHAGWRGMSGSAVLLRDAPDPDTIWMYGVVQEVPPNFNGQLRVARLADAWQDPKFRDLLVAAGAVDEEPEDPTQYVSDGWPRITLKFLCSKAGLLLVFVWLAASSLSVFGSRTYITDKQMRYPGKIIYGARFETDSFSADWNEAAWKLSQDCKQGFNDFCSPYIKHVPFANRFIEKPTILVSIYWMDVSLEAHIRLQVAVKDIQPDGFNIEVTKWSDSKLERIQIWWLAIETAPDVPGKLRRVLSLLNPI